MIFSPGTLPWQTGQPALVEGSTYQGRLEQPDQRDPRAVVVVVVVDNQRGPRVVVVVVDIASLSRDLWAEVGGWPPKIISQMTNFFPSSSSSSSSSSTS